MSNLIGKAMVQVHLVISMLAFGWAAGMYFEYVDWGWKTPRRELDYAIPSEYDRRVVRQIESYRRRDNNYFSVQKVWENLREAEGYFVDNKLWYDAQLKQLVSGPDPVDLKQLRFIDGILSVETRDNRRGKPEFEAKALLEKAKCYESYVDDLKNLRHKARLVEKEYAEWLLKQRASTIAKVGEYDGDRKVKPGLIDLRQLEYQAQTAIIDEIRYLEPREVEFRKEAEIYRERRELLDQDKTRALKGFTMPRRDAGEKAP